MAAPEVADMSHPLFFIDRFVPLFDCVKDLRNITVLDALRFERTDIGCGLSRVNDSIGHISLECTFAGKGNDADKQVPWNSETFGQGADVSVILTNRILESVFGSKDGLRPFRRSLVAEYPAGISLDFNDENAVSVDDDLIDLGGRSVREWEVDVGQMQANSGESVDDPSRHGLLSSLADPRWRQQNHLGQLDRSDDHDDSYDQHPYHASINLRPVSTRISHPNRATYR